MDWQPHPELKYVTLFLTDSHLKSLILVSHSTWMDDTAQNLKKNYIV